MKPGYCIACHARRKLPTDYCLNCHHTLDTISRRQLVVAVAGNISFYAGVIAAITLLAVAVV